MNYNTHFDTLLSSLHKNDLNISHKHIFNRGDSDEFILEFYIDRVTDRPEFNKYKKIRNNKYTKTLKNIKNKTNFMYYGININDINNNIDNNEYEIDINNI